MSRNTGGIYSLPGTDFVTGTVIRSNDVNQKFTDIETALTDSLSRAGNGNMLAPLRVPDGSAAIPSLSWSADIGTGFYLAATSSFRAVILASTVQEWTSTGVSINKALTVSQAATLSSTLGVTGATTLSSTLAVTGATTLSSTLAVTGGVTGNGGGTFTNTTTGSGVTATGGPTGGAGVTAAGGTTNGRGVTATGTGTAPGVYAAGGATAAGVEAVGGATNGAGVIAIGGGTAAGILATGGNSSGHGVVGTGGTGGRGGQFTGSAGNEGVRAIAGTAATASVQRNALGIVDGYVGFAAVNPDSDIPFQNAITPANIIKAFAKITTDGLGGVTLNTGFNITGVALNTGAVVITFAQDFSSANFVCTVTAADVYSDGTTGAAPVVFGATVGQVSVELRKMTTAAQKSLASTPAVLHVICTGHQ